MRIISTKPMLILSMLFIFTGGIFGQSTLQGIVTDSLTQEALIGASISLVGTSQGAATNLEGEYRIPNITEGTYKIKVSYVGYLPKQIDLSFKGNKTLQLFIQLSPTRIEGKTIEVSAQAQGQLSAINEQLSSNKIVNIVSADKMKELPDANIAESIGRLPGVSLGRTNGEADKVIIRGLSAQFNKVTIEGVPMVSTSGGLAAGATNYGSSNYSDRSIDLSLLSDDLVKGVELSKSLRANMDADAIGGTINLTLKEAPAGLHYDIQSNGGYNALISSWKNYKISGSVSNRFFDNAIGLRLQLSAEDKALPSQQFNAGYDGVSPQSLLDPATNKVTLNLIRNTNSSRLTIDDLDRKRYGGSVIFDYESDLVDILFLNTYVQKREFDQRYDNSINFEAVADGLFSKYYSVSNFDTEERTHSLQSKFKFWGSELNASLSYTKGNYHNPGYDFPFIQVNTTNPYKVNAYLYANPASLMALAGSDKPTDFYLRTLERTDNSLNDNDYDLKLDYTIPFKLSDDLSGKFYAGGKFHEMDRNNRGNSSEFSLEYGGNETKREAFLLWLNQNFIPNATGTNPNHGISGLNFIDHNYTAPKFLNGRYTMDPWEYNIGLLSDIGREYYEQFPELYSVVGPESYNSLYNLAEKLRAGYIMAEINIGTDLTIVPGLRYEEERNTDGAYVVYTNNVNRNGLAGQLPIWRSINTTDVNYFPSVNVKYKAGENVQIMGAYYSSIARPDFSAISPLIDYAIDGSINASSNPYLKPAVAQNFDLGTSLFSNTIGLFSVNLFYKEIKDLVYSIPSYMPYKRGDIVNAPSDILKRLPGLAYFDSTWLYGYQSATTSIPINNPEKAYIRGIELSWQTHLWYLPGILSGLVLDLNLSFLSSHTYYPYFDDASAVKDTLWSPDHKRVKKIDYYQDYKTRPGAVLNQPKAIYNAIIGWDYLGFSSRVSFRYQQTTLTGLDAKFSLADTYYDNVLLIDISLKQKIIGNLAVFTNFTNVGSHVDDYYYTSPKGNLPTSSQTYGFNAQFGVSYSY
jgi:TonB-dependent receptor